MFSEVKPIGRKLGMQGRPARVLCKLLLLVPVFTAPAYHLDHQVWRARPLGQDCSGYP